ncbi:MAG: hypothetical protein M1834_001966 [Cirrosporium novae-zelandiae]|nr:MAG: hypothetical protein M1834_001966 [Cirrosporium novae-zelandiae]
MSGVTDPSKAAGQTSEASLDKGKGKAVDQPMEDATMDEDDTSDEEADDHVPSAEVEEDNLEEIDPDNIINGPRTRGRNIDFAKVAAEQKEEDDYDEDADDDFVAKVEDEDEEMKD